MESKPTPLAYLADDAPAALWDLFRDGVVPIRESESMGHGDPPLYTIEPKSLTRGQILALATLLAAKEVGATNLQAVIDWIEENGFGLLVEHCKGMSLDGGATIWPPLKTETITVGTVVKTDATDAQQGEG
jgi:hypothetical protein